MNTEEVIKVWLKGDKEAGGTPKRQQDIHGNRGEFVSLFFQGDLLYSYGTHYVLGRKEKSGKILVNSEWASKTTKRQQNSLKALATMAGISWEERKGLGENV